MRLSSGVPGFDALVQGGIPAGAAVVVQGPAGREKDTFLFQFVIAGLQGGGSALVVLASVSPAKYMQELREAGVDVDRAVSENRLKFVDWFTYKENPVQDVEQDGPVFRASIDLANVGIAISRAISTLPREGERRAAVEVLSPALSVYDLSGVYGFAQGTKAKLERSGFTSLFVLDEDMHDERTASSIHQPFDGVVDIERVREGDELVRKIAVLSLRGTAAESKYVALELGADRVLRVSTASVRERTLLHQEELIKWNPKDPKLWLAAARNLRGMGDHDRALKCVEAALQLDPRDQEALRLRSEVLDVLRQTSGNEQETARWKPPTPARDDSVVRFLADVEQRLQSDPRDADALFVKAAGQARSRDLAGAIETLEKLAEVDETYPGLWVLKTTLHARRGELDKAEQSLARRREIEKRHETSATQPPKPSRTSSPQPSTQAQSFCPICGARVGEEDAACPSCGAGFAGPVRAPAAPTVVPPTRTPAVVPEPIAVKRPEPKVPPLVRPPAPRLSGQRAARMEPEPRATPPIEPDATKRPEGLASEIPRGPGRTNGLVNGLRGRTNGVEDRQLGRTNGLVNGSRGRTNGLVNGLRGRTNGLVNGLRGRTNGVGEGQRGRTNGIVNGIRGRTNGLEGALRGKTNGLTNGLTNGSGFTNGLATARLARDVRRTRWEVYAIPIVTLVLLLVPILASDPFSPPGGIVVDGDAADWDVARIAPQARSLGTNPNVDIVRAGTVADAFTLSFLVEVQGAALSGGGSPATTDRFHVFLDTDRDPNTGYAVDSLGADRLIDVSGHNGTVEDASLLSWEGASSVDDWRGWDRLGSVAAAVAQGRLEIQADWPAIAPEPTSVAAVIHARAFDATLDTSDGVFHSAGGSLSLLQEPVVANLLTGPAAALLLRVDATAFGGDATISGLNVRLTGLANLTSVTAVRLVDALGSLIDQRIPVGPQIDFRFTARTISSASPQRFFVIADILPSDGNTFGAIVADASDVQTNVPVSLRRAPSAQDVGYLSIVPAAPRIDGGFSEWTASLQDTQGDAGQSEIDLTAFDARFAGNASFLYAAVDGRLLSGTWVPEGNRAVHVRTNPDADGDTVPDIEDLYPFDFNNDLVPDVDSGGDVDADGVLDYGQVGGTDWWLNTTIPATFPAPYGGRAVNNFIGPWEPPFQTRDDMLRVFVDLDNSSATGYAIATMGADRLVEVSGREGELRSGGYFSFGGSNPGQWSWTPGSEATVALAFSRMEFSVAENFSIGDTRMFVEARAALGTLDNVAGTRGAGAHGWLVPSGSANSRGALLVDGRQSPGPQPFDISGNQKLYLRDANHGTETACTTNKVASTQGSTSLKTVTLTSGQSACWYADSTTGTTISAGDWETLLDVDTSVPKSAFKDGSSVDVPSSSIGLLDSLATTFPSADNLVVAAIQLDKTDTGTATISAGNLELRRGTSTSDPLIAENQFQISLSANDAAGDGLFAVLVGLDASAPASSTYGVFGLASTSTIDAEVKMVVINGVASADDEFSDGGSVSFTSSPTVLTSRTTSFPASSSSLPNIFVAAAQFDRTAGTQSDLIPTTGIEVRRGTTNVAGIQFRQSITSAANPDGVFALLVGIDTAAGANPTYDVRAWDDNGATVSGEAKLLLFRGFAAAEVDSGSVSIGTTRTVLGTATTSFATGEDVLIGAIQLEGSGGSRKFAVDANDIRLVGASSDSSNEFAHTVGATDSAGSGMWESFVRKVTTTSASPSYEGAATRPSSGAANGELKLVAIHVNDSAAEYDVHLEIWNLNTNDVAETIKSCTDVTTRGEDVRCFITGVAQKTISSTQVVRIRLVHSSSSGKVAFDFDYSDPTGNSRATIPTEYIPEFEDLVLPVFAAVFIPVFWRWSPRRHPKRKREATA